MAIRGTPSRLLLPKGAGRLRTDLGDFLKQRRQGKLDSEPFGTQAEIACRVGIRRQTLSQIERGAAWPGPATLDALLDILDLGWEHVAHPIASGVNPRYLVDDMPGGGRSAQIPPALAPKRYRTFLEGMEGKQIIALGERLKFVRKRRGMTIVEVARHAGLSAALLSRLERGQLTMSHVFRFDPPEVAGGSTTLIVLNSYLAGLCALEQAALDGSRDEVPGGPGIANGK